MKFACYTPITTKVQFHHARLESPETTTEKRGGGGSVMKRKMRNSQRLLNVRLCPGHRDMLKVASRSGMAVNKIPEEPGRSSHQNKDPRGDFRPFQSGSSIA